MSQDTWEWSGSPPLSSLPLGVQKSVLPKYLLFFSQDTWEWSRFDVPPEAPQPCPRDRSSMVALDNDRLLVFGGADAVNKRLDDVWIFDIST